MNANDITVPMVARFFSKVRQGQEPNDCWIWTGSNNSKGYGQFYPFPKSDKVIASHRFSWAAFFGTVSSDINVLHTCDNGMCVNPKHLFLGSHADNVADMVEKGRHVRGATHPQAILTEQAVRKIRAHKMTPALAKKFATEYGVTVSTIGHIVRRETWRHL